MSHVLFRQIQSITMTKSTIVEILPWNTVVEILRGRLRSVFEVKAEIIQRVAGRGPDTSENGYLHITLRNGEWVGNVDEGGCSGTTGGTSYSVKSHADISGGWYVREVIVGEMKSVSSHRMGSGLKLPFACPELLQYLEQNDPFIAGRGTIEICDSVLFFLGVTEDKVGRTLERYSRESTIWYFAPDDGFLILEQCFDRYGDPMAEVEYRRLARPQL